MVPEGQTDHDLRAPLEADLLPHFGSLLSLFLALSASLWLIGQHKDLLLTKCLALLNLPVITIA